MIKVEDGAGRMFSCEYIQFSSSSSRRLRELGYVKAYLTEDQKIEEALEEDTELFVKATQLLAVISNDSTLHLGQLCIIKKEV